MPTNGEDGPDPLGEGLNFFVRKLKTIQSTEKFSIISDKIKVEDKRVIIFETISSLLIR